MNEICRQICSMYNAAMSMSTYAYMINDEQMDIMDMTTILLNEAVYAFCEAVKVRADCPLSEYANARRFRLVARNHPDFSTLHGQQANKDQSKHLRGDHLRSAKGIME